MDEIFAQIAEKIIERQEDVIGPVAVQQAQRVKALKIDWPNHRVSITGNAQLAIDQLVEQYKALFGQIAVETCKEAASRYLAELPASQLPKTLE
jgi:hypothetical protein